MSPALEQYRLLQIKLEELLVKNAGLESEEEDLLLDEMDHLWHQMTDEEWGLLWEEK